MVFDRMSRKLKKTFLRNCLTEFEVIIQKVICFPKQFQFFRNKPSGVKLIIDF